MINLRLDDRVEIYKSFLDYPWLQDLEQRVRGTALDKPFMRLIVTWKGTANAYAMPYLMMTTLASFEKGYLRPQESLPEHAIQAMAQAVPKRMAEKHKLSHSKQQQFKEVCLEILQTVEYKQRAYPELDKDAMFKELLHAKPGGSELQVGVKSLIEVCFSGLFHAYEHFVSQCIKIGKGGNYSTRRFELILKGAKEVFGPDVAEFCLTHDEVVVARAVRNSLAHNGSEYSTDMFGRPIEPATFARLDALLKQDYFVEEGEIKVVAANTVKLFRMLAVRVSKLIDKALTLDAFK
jgi:hypothetical protein